MKPSPRDYTNLTAICLSLNLIPYSGYLGSPEGIYSFKGLHAPVDLSACAEDGVSILKTALEQLSERCDDSTHDAIERSLFD